MASSRFILTHVRTSFQTLCWSVSNRLSQGYVTSVFPRRSFHSHSILKRHVPLNNQTALVQSGLKGQFVNSYLHRHSVSPLHSLGLYNVDSPTIRCVSTRARQRHSKQSVASKNRISRSCSSKQTTNGKNNDKEIVKEPQEEESLSVFARFKKAYREHGKVLIGVHIATSTVWISAFYFAAKSGIDVVPILEKLGANETIIKPFKSSGLGDIAVAYLLYKLATPARYTVTLGGTNLAIRYLRNKGHMKPIKEGHSLRELYKDGKTELKTKHAKIKTDLSQQRKDRLKRIRELRNRSKKL